MNRYQMKLIQIDYEFCKRLAHLLTLQESQFLSGLDTQLFQLYTPTVKARLRAIVERLCDEEL